MTALSAITSGAAPALEATATSITINKCGAAQSTTAQQWTSCKGRICLKLNWQLKLINFNCYELLDGGLSRTVTRGCNSRCRCRCRCSSRHPDRDNPDDSLCLLLLRLHSNCDRQCPGALCNIVAKSQIMLTINTYILPGVCGCAPLGCFIARLDDWLNG